MLQNRLLAEIGFDTAESEPCENFPRSQCYYYYSYHYYYYRSLRLLALQENVASGREKKPIVRINTADIRGILFPFSEKANLVMLCRHSVVINPDGCLATPHLLFVKPVVAERSLRSEYVCYPPPAYS